MRFLQLIDDSAKWVELADRAKTEPVKRFARTKYLQKLEQVEYWKDEIAVEATQIKKDR